MVAGYILYPKISKHVLGAAKRYDCYKPIP